MFNATPLVRLYRDFRLRQLAKQQPAPVQQQQLLTLLHKAKNTRFGQDHAFHNIRSVDAFQQQVPLRTYDDLWEEYWQASFPMLNNVTWPGKIPFFGISTGTTTGREKHIPVSWDMVRSNKRGTFDLFTHHLHHKPNSQLMAGKGVMIAGFIFVPVKTLAPDIYASLLPSILLKKTIPPWIKPWYLTELKQLENIPALEDKWAHLAEIVLQHDIRSISGFPTRLLVFFKTLQAQHKKNGEFLLKDYFPKLELLVHGGIAMAPYQQQFMAMLQDSQCELREIYPSTEGFFAVADQGMGEGLRLICDHQIFYEFIPLTEFDQPQPTVHWLADVEPGIDYALVISTCAGLWRYIVGDVVRFITRDPPRLYITGRTTQTLSIFGEKFLEVDFNRAVLTAASKVGLMVNEYAVSVKLPQQVGEYGQYHYLIEFSQPPQANPLLQRFMTILEETLCQHSAIYTGKGDILLPAQLHIAAPGSFNAWLLQENKPDGKVPRIWTDWAQFSTLLEKIELLQID